MMSSAREMVRHALYRSGAYGVVTQMRVARGGGASHLAFDDVRSRFQAIYDSGIWQHGEDEAPGSGFGSSMAATEGFRSALPDLLRSLGAQRLLDVGCGDFTWMQHVPLSQTYIGVDVVDSVIARNRAAFAGPSRAFETVDAISEELPDGDVVLCREILFHLSFADIHAVLRNILSKPRAYLIVTSDRQTIFNSDIPSGDFRLLNMQARPFGFPAPAFTIEDSYVCPGRIIGVWRAGDIPVRA